MRSLEYFILGRSALALLLVFGVLLWVGIVAQRSIGESYLLTRVEHDAESLLAAIDRNPRGRLRLREGRITPIYHQPLSGHYFVVVFEDGSRVDSRSLWDETLNVPQLSAGEVRTLRVAGPAGQHLLVRVAGYRKAALGFTLAVAEDLTPIEDQTRRFQAWTVAILCLSFFLLLGIQRKLLRRGFLEIDQVRDELREVALGRRGRLESPGPAEIRPLTAQVNDLLDQLLRRLERSRRSLGNLAHALKTPITLLKRALESADLPEPQRREWIGQLDRVARLADRELRRASLAGRISGQAFVPAQELPDLVDAVRRLHRDRNLQIELAELPEGALPMDRDDLFELLGNLLDNACKWAERRVRVTLAVEQALVIIVEDDGPGVASDALAELTRRGLRLDEQVIGHGLGLSIVHDLVDDYGGEFSLDRSGSLGGLAAKVVLPIRIQSGFSRQA